MTHTQLVESAAAWLSKQRKCSVVITELAALGTEVPDAIGWRGTHSTLVECKTSRADFLADSDKHWRRYPEHGIGKNRYFLTIPGIIRADDLLNGWGLLELTATSVRKVSESKLFECSSRNELSVLLSALKRIGQTCPRGVSIRAYTIESKNRATLGVEIETPEPIPA